MKKVLALVLSILMMLTLTAACFAAEGEEPVAKEKVYVAYQIFSGTQAEGDSKLAGIEWGSGFDGDVLIEALKRNETIGNLFENCVSAEDVALVVSGFADDTEQSRAFASVCCQNKVKGTGTPVSEENTMETGYYLIADETEYGPDDKNVVINLSLLQITKDEGFTIREKVTVPELEKEVFEETGEVWQKAADYDIGDSVPFKLTATIGNISAYKCYQLIFNDTLSQGLKYNSEEPITITLCKKNGSEYGLLSTNVTKNLTVSGFNIAVSDQVLTFAIQDVTKLTPAVEEGDKIVVTYEAKLTGDAVVIGADGNPNTASLQYSNNPNDGCGGELGTTPDSEAMVYTWGVHIDKVTQGEGDLLRPLDGAKFELFLNVAEGDPISLGEKEVEEVKDEDGNIVSYSVDFNGLDRGHYVLKETVTPDGYNGIEDIPFQIVASFKEDSEEIDEFTVIDNGTFTPVEGIAKAQILNKVGVVLPETGGEGTKLLTLVGALALISGMVFVITKKRVGVED